MKEDILEPLLTKTSTLASVPKLTNALSLENINGIFPYGFGSSNIIWGINSWSISRSYPGLVIVTLGEICPVPIMTVAKPICWIDVVAVLTTAPASAETNVWVYWPPARTAFAVALWNEWR